MSYISLMESGALAVFCDLISACETPTWPWVSSREEEPSICYGCVRHKFSVFPLKGEQPAVRASVPAPSGGALAPGGSLRELCGGHPGSGLASLPSLWVAAAAWLRRAVPADGDVPLYTAEDAAETECGTKRFLNIEV